MGLIDKANDCVAHEDDNVPFAEPRVVLLHILGVTLLLMLCCSLSCYCVRCCTRVLDDLHDKYQDVMEPLDDDVEAGDGAQGRDVPFATVDNSDAPYDSSTC